MYKLSNGSRARLDTCHKSIILICESLIEIFDFTVVYGYRDQQLQDELFSRGLSKARFPLSEHNVIPSLAIDLAPYHASKTPHINWHDKDSFIYMAGLFRGIGHEKNIAVRWGGDWDSDNDLSDQIFFDLGHFELLEKND